MTFSRGVAVISAQVTAVLTTMYLVAVTVHIRDATSGCGHPIERTDPTTIIDGSNNADTEGEDGKALLAHTPCCSCPMLLLSPSCTAEGIPCCAKSTGAGQDAAIGRCQTATTVRPSPSTFSRLASLACSQQSRHSALL